MPLFSVFEHLKMKENAVAAMIIRNTQRKTENPIRAKSTCILK